MVPRGSSWRVYADLTRTDAGAFVWNDPDDWTERVNRFEVPPAALAVSRALDRVGALSREGLQVIHEIWSREAFEDDERSLTSDKPIEATLRGLVELGLPREEASSGDVRNRRGAATGRTQGAPRQAAGAASEPLLSLVAR